MKHDISPNRFLYISNHIESHCMSFRGCGKKGEDGGWGGGLEVAVGGITNRLTNPKLSLNCVLT